MAGETFDLDHRGAITMAEQGLTADNIRNLVLTWYSATNEHRPLGFLQAMLSDGVEMRYPNVAGTMISKDAFRKWYEDVLVKYFDETHHVEAWEKIRTEGNHASATVCVRWEARSWTTGAPRSNYEAYLSRQRFEFARLPAQGRVVIAKKIVETFERVAPIFGVGA